MTILVICLVIIFVVYVYLFLRNNQVYNFRLKITNNGFKYLREHLNSYIVINNASFDDFLEEHKKLKDRILELLNRYSYDYMLFSFKKLELDEWFEGEDLEILTKYDDNR